MERSPETDLRFQELYDGNFEAIRNFCIRRLPVEEVNDAVAEVFTIAWRRLPDIPTGDEQRMWLYGVARNVVRNTDRSIRRQTRLFGRLGGLAPSHDPGPETVVVRRSEDDNVVAALRSLPETDQEVLRLSAWEELTNVEIANLLDLDPHAVTMRISRARNRLAKRLHMATVPVQSSVEPYPVTGGGEQ